MLPMCIACAYELASGLGNVCNEMVFNQSAMTLHLVECLEKEEILSFPGALQNITAVCEEKHLV